MNIKNYFKSGNAYVWLNAGAVTICLIMVLGVLTLIAVRGMSYFWPVDVMQLQYNDGTGEKTYIGELYNTEVKAASRLIDAGSPVPDSYDPNADITQWSIKVGNKDMTGQDFIWITKPFISEITYPKDIIKLVRLEGGNFYGRLKSVTVNGKDITGQQAYAALENNITRTNKLYEDIKTIERSDMGTINYALEDLRLEERRLELKNKLDVAAKANLQKQRDELNAKADTLKVKLSKLREQMERDTATFVTADGSEKQMSAAAILEVSQPNAMGTVAKLGHYFSNIWNFLANDPREANTEGGVFPAIFGTIMMVFIMTLLVTPLGVIAAIYLREYASQGRVTQMVRIAVNNLAGVPSIVYGVFGLGFFVYVLGGSIDDLFYPEAAPQPVFGTPGLLWASVTLAILTLPVVIVATEEGLSRIPRNLKEGSLALGATKAETLWKIIVPIATPSIITGMILAIARAAGEVAPLMLVGVVKSTPELPVDLNAPFVHLDRKFMHLGFHIYDVGFQSPNVEAARPLVYATAFLLVLVIAILNLSAITIRNRLREKYKSLES